MSILTFRGGIHPYEGKELSKDKPIQEYIPKGELAISMSQHIGAPAKPVVKKGDRVLAGQLIGEAGGFISANVHSSVSGTVKAVEKRFLVNGGKAECIIIESDGMGETAAAEQPKSYETLSKEEIRDLVKAAGIVGMGGAGFPTHVKLAPKNPDQIDHIIVNGSECEPYLTSDYRRMLEVPEQLVQGLRIMLRLFDKAKGIVAIEDNKPEAIAAVKACVKPEDNIEVKTLRTKYPQGAERMLIFALTGRKINSLKLPADAGCIVDNVDTVLAIYQAVTYGKPLTKRVITVTGDAVTTPQNFLVSVGTNHRELIEAAGGFIEEPEKIISGGPMMGMAISSLDVPVTKISTSLLCFIKDPLTEYHETNCINCGRCVKVCPGRVLPSRLAKFSARGDMESFLQYDGLECCECGCCSYVCPAKINLTQAIKTMRKKALASRKK